MKLLDCTIRDGGYYTKWDFDRDLIKSYLLLIDKLPIDYLEVGYRSIEKDEYLGEYFYLNNLTIKNIKKYTSKKLAIMINAKECIDIEQLLSGLKDDISLVRISTDPDKIEFSLKLARELKFAGFKVSINIMYITKVINSHAFFNSLKNIETKIDFLYLVDSYGSLYPNELENIIKNIQRKTKVKLGFHGHNNLELSFANTLISINNGVDMIDSTILGMGRGAGNLKTELILSHLKSKYNLDVDLNILGDLVEIFQPLLKQYKWSTNLAYMVSGSYALPQKEVMDALEIDRYSLSGIVNYVKNDNELILPIFKFNKKCQNCLIIGGGYSVKEHCYFIKKYLEENSDMVVIHSTSKYIKLFEEVNNIQLFAVSGDELLKVKENNKIHSYVLEPRPRKVNTKLQDKHNFYELKEISFINKYFDSPLSISLQITLDMKVEKIYLFGFDGYNQINTKKELYLMNESQEIINQFVKLNSNLYSLTCTRYKNIIKKSIYSDFNA